MKSEVRLVLRYKNDKDWRDWATYELHEKADALDEYKWFKTKNKTARLIRRETTIKETVVKE